MTDYWLFAMINFVPVMFVIATNPLSGLSRALAPDTLTMVVLYAIFAVRPLFAGRFDASLDQAAGFYRMTPPPEGQLVATIVGTVLLWSIAFGAGLYRMAPAPAERTVNSQSAAEHLPSTPVQMTPRLALLITVGAVILYSVILIWFMGVDGFLAMSRGRSAEASTSGTPEIVMSLPLAGSIASAALVLTTKPGLLTRGAWIAICACTSVSIIAVSQLGNRRLIIPALMIVAISLLMRRNVAIRFWHLAVGMLCIIVLAIMPNVRSAGSRVDGEDLFGAIIRSYSETGAYGVLERFFTSYDTEMYDYVAMLAARVEAGQLEFGWGRGTLVEFLAHPLPANLTPGTPRSAELKTTLFNDFCFGVGCNFPNPVQSLGGTLYFDGGYIAVLGGGIATGMFVRALSTRWARASVLSARQNVLVAVAASYAMVAVRTDTIFAIWWAIYAVLITVAVLAIARLAEESNAPLRTRHFRAMTPATTATPRLDR